jgi:hypothetical protein
MVKDKKICVNGSIVGVKIPPIKNAKHTLIFQDFIIFLIENILKKEIKSCTKGI